MMDEFDKDANFFPVSMNNTKDILKTAMLGRNSVVHGYLPLLLLDGGNYLLSWISVCRLIDQTEAADELRKIYDQIYAGMDAPLRNHTEPVFSIPEYVEPIPRPESLDPALRSYFIAQPGGEIYDNSVMDSQSYLEDLIRLWEQNPTSPWNDAKIKCLKKAKFARNSLCHADLLPLLASYEEFLQSWIEVCLMIGNPLASARIQRVKDYISTHYGHQQQNNSLHR